MEYKEYADWRDKNKISDYKVSEDAHISRSTFTQWRKGALTPSAQTINKLKEYMAFYTDISSQKGFNRSLSAPDNQETIFNYGSQFGVAIDAYILRLPNGKTARLSAAEYGQLQRDMQDFVASWIEYRGRNY